MFDTLSATRLGPAKCAPNHSRMIRRAIADAVQAWRIASAQRRIAAELSALHDHVLKDIGIPRNMIHAAARVLAEAGIRDRQG